MSYAYFRRYHPGWPEFIEDVTGRSVRMRHRTVTRGGVVFEEGTIMQVNGSHRGVLSLRDTDGRHISKVPPHDVELLPPASIVWRNKEAFLLFCIAVAGKNSRQTQQRVEELLSPCDRRIVNEPDASPFEHLRNLIASCKLLEELQAHGFGQYTKLLRAFTEAATSDLDLDRVTVEQLERIHGVGPKTSRYFIMRTQPTARVAALDTHILRWLRDEMGHEDVPESTPSEGPQYERVERLFLEEARRLRKRPSRLDAEIWDRYSRSGMDMGESAHVDGSTAFSRGVK